jgi:hypothetical protein
MSKDSFYGLICYLLLLIGFCGWLGFKKYYAVKSTKPLEKGVWVKTEMEGNEELYDISTQDVYTFYYGSNRVIIWGLDKITIISTSNEISWGISKYSGRVATNAYVGFYDVHKTLLKSYKFRYNDELKYELMEWRYIAPQIDDANNNTVRFNSSGLGREIANYILCDSGFVKVAFKCKVGDDFNLFIPCIKNSTVVKK